MTVTLGSGGGRLAESAKARIRRASLLSVDYFKALLELTSVGDVATHLGKSVYAPVFNEVSLENTHRSELEFLLGVAILAEGWAFRHYAGLSDKKLLKLWLEYFDVMLFKGHFRLTMGTGGWDNNLDPAKVLDMVSDFQMTMLDKEKLLSANSLKDMILSVKNPDLRAALFDATHGRESLDTAQGAEFQQASFNMGMMMDRHYFDNLYSAVVGMGGVEGRMMRMLVGVRVDLMNLYWIYRARRFFNMTPEESLTLVMKSRYQVNFELLTKVAFAEPNILGQVLSGTPYAYVFEAETSSAALREVEIECRINRLLCAAAERVFLSGSFGFQNVAAYLMLKELEVKDLVAVIESVRYGFDRSKTDLFLVRLLGKVN